MSLHKKLIALSVLQLLLINLSAVAVPTSALSEMPGSESMALSTAGPDQNGIVSGIIKDENGEPLMGATVREKGNSANGVITDVDGKFSISIQHASAVLEVSYVGYEKTEVNVQQGKVVDLRLRPDNTTLDGIVVVGYGSMKKSDLTGSVSRADIKDFQNSPNVNVGQLLQGTIPGLNVGVTTNAGDVPGMSIRGKNTISGNSNVLIVLDGIIYNSTLASINPNDIESIDVLKDASATAVYGAQAANGVILITTKRGQEGKTRIDVSSSYTFSNPTRDYKPMNRSQYLQYLTDQWYEKSYVGPDYVTPNPDFRLADYLPDIVMKDDSQPDGISALDYDWWGDGTQTASIMEDRISASGKSGIVSYLLSYGYTDQKGIIKNDNFKRNSIRMNFDITPYKWLKFGVQSFGSFVNKDGAQPDIWALRTQNPLISPYDENGNIVPYPFNTLDKNPFMGSNIADKERHNYFFGNLYAEIKLPLDGLTYHINFGNNYRVDDHNQSNQYGASLTGDAYKNHSQYYDYTVDNIFNYNNTFGKHSVAATFVVGVSERKYDYTSADAQDFARITLGYNSLQLGKNQYTTSNSWKEALTNQMLRVNYKYADKYLLTATVRRDGFSGFAKNNKSSVFPSLALAWVLSNEKFFKVSWVDNLKIRAGWGVSGNMTSRYNSLAKVNSLSAYVFGDGGSTEMGQKIVSMGNDDLKWERTSGINGGLDFVLLNNRISGYIDCYYTTTKDLLYNIAVPSASGFTSVSSNIGKLRNQGLEISITSHNIVQKDFEWSTTFNFSTNKNKLITLTGQDNDGDGKEDDLVASGLFMGKSLSAVYGYKVDGIYQLDDKDIPAGFHPGNYRIVDVDGDGEITTRDRCIIGKTDPAYRMSMLNTLRYKDFTFSFFLNSVQGGKDSYLGANSLFVTCNTDNDDRWNMYYDQVKRIWSPSNPKGIYARSTKAPKIRPTRYEQRNFVRLQDISLGYNLPNKLIEHIGLHNANVYISGKNLLTFTKWHGWDPEANQNYGGRPVLKSISFGINLSL